MRSKRPAIVLALAALALSPLPALALGSTDVAAPVEPAPALQPWLESHLAEVGSATRLRVMVRGTSEKAAAAAVEAVGMGVQQQWPLVDVAIGVGPASAVRGLLDQPGVLYVEGDQPLAYHLDTAHVATRSADAAAAFPTVNGAGVSIAVIDSGIDGTHPFFQQDGATKVVQNRKNACGIDFQINPTLSETCFVSASDTDTISGGGHGTHVAGIAAGVPVTTASPAGRELRGSASGAKLVGLSVGAAVGLLDSAAAQNWVLEHQQNPCRSAAEQTANEVDPDCPPIRVTNHSYGPIATEGEDQEHNPKAASVKIQQALVAKGVVAVWAAGNDAGDGSYAATNPDAMDPTPGVIMVASYNDEGSGSRDNALSDFSSRGKISDPGTYPDVSAPGDLITSACRAYLTVCTQGTISGEVYDNGDYNTISGTSMASPYVAGVVAQLFQANPSLTPADVEDILEDTAYKFAFGGEYVSDPRNGDDTTSFDKGHGLVDVVEALASATGTTAPAATAGCTTSSYQVTDPEGDAVQVTLTNTPLPTAPSLDVRKAWLTWDDAAQTLTYSINVTDLAAGPPSASNGEYFRFYTTQAGDPETYVVATRSGDTQSFSLKQFDSGATTPLTGVFDLATSTVSVVLPAASYGLVVPGGTLASGDRIDVGQVLGQRSTGAATLTADTATGSCPFLVGTSTPGVQAPTEEPPADCTRPNGKPCKGKGGS